MRYMVGVDVGGTFTDITMIDSVTGNVNNHKLPSTPEDPSIAIMKGIEELLALHNVPNDQVTYLAHGTTVATNAIIERKGAKTALIVTKGFKDLLEIGRQTRPSLYDLFKEKPEPVISGDIRYEVEERLYANGSVRTPINKDQLKEIVTDIKRRGITSIAVCFLFSFKNIMHEKIALEEIGRLYPSAYVSASHEIVPEFREYPRLSTTVMNAYLGPVMKKYMENFRSSVKKSNIPVEPYITQSNGGIISIQESVINPIKTALSGPAAGVVAASYIAELTKYNNLITFDMGGTSADFSLIENGNPKISMEREIEGFPARVPMLDIHTYGAGGGSIAWLDDGGALKVGPESAGAIPGPVAYGRGGTLPTVTDANVVLGRLNPNGILNGKMDLDVNASKKAIKEHICDKTNLSLIEAASGILSVVNANMARGVRLISVEKGYSPSEFALVSFGGGGGLHCGSLAKELNISTVIVPPSPGTFSSMGLLVTDIKSDYVRTELLEPKEQNLNVIIEHFKEMMLEGTTLLEAENIEEDKRNFICTIDIRFKGQNYELSVPIHINELNNRDIDFIVERFHVAHEKTYGYSNKLAKVEFVNYRLTACGNLPKVPLNKGNKGEGEIVISKSKREVYFSEVEEPGYYETDIFQRSELVTGDKINGPAIVDQLDSTILILPNQQAIVDPYQNLIIKVNGEVKPDGKQY
ncbi:hydantoinase/oxoprolinase family protein [Virgibacillus dakarensis]|uniref:Methylhydantoinase n=1 Tax=Lentibacillus populi TaxID=1827502 RepID=A0A9W5TWF8_9BACI|nr:hydantoinase/oxoprolinase family protein [Lentibacillus populi]MTW85819.1 hydantoinase/oxoprolinase family protein [Virgibacillus dakarensis]GGB39230.1 methylhydantoinase [Lentibacillus populi]